MLPRKTSVGRGSSGGAERLHAKIKDVYFAGKLLTPT
jgi:hypothetical protein